MRGDSPPAAGDVAEVETADGKRVRVRLAINPRARRVSVRIDPTRRLAIATAPSQRQLKRAAQFAAERAGWIARELDALPVGQAFMPHATAPLRGVLHELIFESGRGVARIEEGARLVIPAPELALFEMRARRFFKAEATADLTERVNAHCATLGVKAARIQVKDMRSRWGSCSVDGVLAFSWRVVCAPPFVLNYLAAHEVAHLREMNHSRRFWAQVAKAMPDWERGRDWLQMHGAGLHAVGEAGEESVVR
jgi:predicted metal-dependent hydrolase